MNLLTIAWKSIRQRTLASFLTALSIGLGVMLMVLVRDLLIVMCARPLCYTDGRSHPLVPNCTLMQLIAR